MTGNMQTADEWRKQLLEQQEKLRNRMSKTKIANELSIPFLGNIPIDQKICEASDKGTPFVVEYKDSPASKVFMEIVKKVEDFLKAREKA
jgi:septum formation inhibitor-activating ATPase MinD